MLLTSVFHQRKRPSNHRRRRPQRARLFLEPLEDRNLLSAPVNVNTDSEGSFHNETTIAVNPTNPLNMIGGANDFQGTVNPGGQLYFTAYHRARVTFDGGQTWTTYPVPYNGYNSLFDPSVSFDADGTAYLASVARVHSQNFLHSTELDTADDIVVSHSTDGGRTWSHPVRVAIGKGTNGPKVHETDNDKEYVAAWGHGNAIVTWSQINWGPQGEAINAPVLASVTHDGGNTWTVPVQISGPLGFFAVPTVAADGSVAVAYTTFNTFLELEDRDRYEVVKVDPVTGQALGAPVEVGLIYDGSNDYPLTVEGGRTYQDSELHSWPGGNITADPTNALHLAVIWSDMRNSNLPAPANPYQAKTNSDIIVSQSFDGGAHWSVPAAIATPNDQFQPWGAYDASGRLQIGYYDRSYDPANHKYGYTLASETTPATLNFTLQQVTTALSDPTQGDAFIVVTVNSNFPNATVGIGDYSGIAITPTGVAALWTDLRLPSSIFPGNESFPGSGQDAFFALVPLPTSGSTAATLVTAAAPSSLASGVPALQPANSSSSGAAAAPWLFSPVNASHANAGDITVGLPFSHAIWDINAAGMGWLVQPAPADNSEFTPRHNQADTQLLELNSVWEWDELGQFIRAPLVRT